MDSETLPIDKLELDDLEVEIAPATEALAAQMVPVWYNYATHVA